MRATEFIRRFVRAEAFGGLIVLAAVVTALVWVNLGQGYDEFWLTELSVGVDGQYLSIGVGDLIGDVAMSAFFLLIGLEVRRELSSGHLRSWPARLAPLSASLAGTLLPAAIYLAIAPSSQRAGWAIPTSTDISVAVGTFTLLARWLHPATRVLLLSIAVIDDVIGIGLLAVISSGNLRPVPLGGALAVTLGLYALGRRINIGVTALVLVWVLLLVLLTMGGLHPTLTGVLLAAAVSTGPKLAADPGVNEDGSEIIEVEHPITAVERLELALLGWVTYGVLPVFVLSHAGVRFDAATDTTTAVALALLIGKPVAVTASLLIGRRLGWFRIANGLGLRDLAVIGALCGAGLTVSSLIAGASLDAPGPAVLGALYGTAASLVVAFLLAVSPRPLQRRKR